PTDCPLTVRRESPYGVRGPEPRQTPTASSGRSTPQNRLDGSHNSSAGTLLRTLEPHVPRRHAKGQGSLVHPRDTKPNSPRPENQLRGAAQMHSRPTVARRRARRPTKIASRRSRDLPRQQHVQTTPPHRRTLG